MSEDGIRRQMSENRGQKMTVTRSQEQAASGRKPVIGYSLLDPGEAVF
jgi:hypothetical protein